MNALSILGLEDWIYAKNDLKLIDKLSVCWNNHLKDAVYGFREKTVNHFKLMSLRKNLFHSLSILPKTIVLLCITKQQSDLQDSTPENYKKHP